MTIESLARAIHADERAVCDQMHLINNFPDNPQENNPPWEALNEEWKEYRMRQARLMFERIMR